VGLPLVSIAQWRAVVSGSSAGGEMRGCCSTYQIFGHSEAVRGAHEAPHSDCTCGIYAAKNIEHLRQSGYERYGIHEKSTCGARWWSTNVAGVPSCVSEEFVPDARRNPVHTDKNRRPAENTDRVWHDIFIVGDPESILFWKNGSGFDAAALDYLIKARKEYYVRRQWSAP